MLIGKGKGFFECRKALKVDNQPPHLPNAGFGFACFLLQCSHSFSSSLKSSIFEITFCTSVCSFESPCRLHNSAKSEQHRSILHLAGPNVWVCLVDSTTHLWDHVFHSTVDSVTPKSLEAWTSTNKTFKHTLFSQIEHLQY